VWVKEALPPCSPDNNLVDYFVWGVSESSVKIKEVMRFLDRDTVARACKRLHLRIEAIVTADVNFIE